MSNKPNATLCMACKQTTVHPQCGPLCENCFVNAPAKGLCGRCQAPVQKNEAFVLQDNAFYHRACFGDLICFSCSKEIQGETVRALDHTYHPECFTCTKCKQPLEEFGVMQKQPYCGTCYKQAQIQTRPMCSGCKGVIKDQALQLGNGHFYHEMCFRCAHCNNKLEADHVLHDDKPFHRECFATLQARKCHRCHAVMSGEYVTFQNYSYHPNCFKCIECDTVLSGEFVQRIDGPACVQCGDKLKPKSAGDFFRKGNEGASKLGGNSACFKCDQPLYFGDDVPGPKATKWHRSCLKCTKCAKQLDSMAKLRNENPFCTTCY